MIERRHFIRNRTYLGAQIRAAFQRSDTPCLVRDLTTGGALIAVSRTIMLPDRFNLVIPWREERHRVELVWRRGDLVGVRFGEPVGSEGIAAPAVGRTLH